MRRIILGYSPELLLFKLQLFNQKHIAVSKTARSRLSSNPFSSSASIPILTLAPDPEMNCAIARSRSGRTLHYSMLSSSRIACVAWDVRAVLKCGHTWASVATVEWEKEKRENGEKKKSERKRITRHITLSQETHELLHESVTNAPRFIEALTLCPKNKIRPVILTLSRIGDGPGGIRTHGHPVMSRAT